MASNGECACKGAVLGTGRPACWQEQGTAAVRELLGWHGVAEEVQRTERPWCPVRPSFRAVLPVKWEFYYCLDCLVDLYRV